MTFINIEKHADLEHEIWASWMQYLFTACVANADGSLTIPAKQVKHWKIQMTTPYAMLTEYEKNSDREQVGKHVLLEERGWIERYTEEQKP